jgi:hypothetical protein
VGLGVRTWSGSSRGGRNNGLTKNYRTPEQSHARGTQCWRLLNPSPEPKRQLPERHEHVGRRRSASVAELAHQAQSGSARFSDRNPTHGTATFFAVLEIRAEGVSWS